MKHNTIAPSNRSVNATEAAPDNDEAVNSPQKISENGDFPTELKIGTPECMNICTSAE